MVSFALYSFLEILCGTLLTLNSEVVLQGMQREYATRSEWEVVLIRYRRYLGLDDVPTLHKFMDRIEFLCW